MAARPRELKRLEKELQDIRALAKDGKEAQVSADSVENDLTHWKAWLKGPEGTPYHGGLFDIDIEIPAEYPYNPPKMKFDTKIWHPNISSQVDFSASKAFDYDRSVNYYEVLGIDEYEPLDEVNRAYKRLSLVYHPDKTKGMSSQQQQECPIQCFQLTDRLEAELGGHCTGRPLGGWVFVLVGEAQKSQHVDLTEVLKRISEMQRPPGKNVEVTLQMELEHFFYGVHKVIPRNRRVKDFYAGMVTQEHLYRLHVERGAAEPVEISFKILERSGDDLIRREEIQLGPGSLTEAYFQANLSSLRGRQLLLWGQNPFFPSWRSHSPASHLLNISVLSEGLSNSGRLHFRCRFSAAETKDLVAAKEAVDNSGVWDPVFFAQSQRMTPAELHRTVGAAVQAISGEWHLIAKAVRLLHVGQCDFARFTRNSESTDALAIATPEEVSARAKRAVCESEILLQPFGEEHDNRKTD
eukprot:g4036.t1